MAIPSIIDDREYILAKSIPEPNTGCWLWLGSVNGDGYGTGWRPKWQKPAQTAHRIAYKAFKSDVPNEKVIAHSCDTPSCCNPDHLWVATQKENINDASKKNRIAFGERAAKSKLNNEIVKEIRSSTLSTYVLASHYGVDSKTIYSVRSGKSWKRDVECQV